MRRRKEPSRLSWSKSTVPPRPPHRGGDAAGTSHPHVGGLKRTQAVPAAVRGAEAGWALCPACSGSGLVGTVAAHGPRGTCARWGLTTAMECSGLGVMVSPVPSSLARTCRMAPANVGSRESDLGAVPGLYPPLFLRTLVRYWLFHSSVSPLTAGVFCLCVLSPVLTIT